MSDEVRIDLDGERQTGLRFETFPDALRDELRGEIDSLSHELLARIEAVIPEKTGKLRSQVRLRMFDEDNRIKGYIDIAGEKGSTDYAKAGALEYGSRGRPVEVAAHSMRLDHFWHHKLNAPITVLTEASKRTPTIEEHGFMRGPLAAMRPEIISRLTAVVERAVDEAN